MNILLVSTSSWAGMGPYASEIINSFANDLNVYYFVVEDERHFFSKNITKGMHDRGRIMYRENSSINKLMDLFFPPSCIEKPLMKFCKEKEIDVIHFLTSEVPYSKTIQKLVSQYKVFFTVHDLHPHESKKAFHKQLRHKMMYHKLAQTRQGVLNLITNSRSQERELKEMYPSKNIYYHEFPSLINQTIVRGKEIPPELDGLDDYVLFFGRIEQYKGIDLAYKAFTEDPALRKHTLVLAGSGDIYFPIVPSPNIVFINRYIKDEEVACLFEHAKVTLYPYISATQSGVLSVSCYFGKPIVASDVPFFQSVEKNGLGVNFRCGDIEDMKEKVKKILASDTALMSDTEKKYYASNFSEEGLRHSLMQIYQK